MIKFITKLTVLAILPTTVSLNCWANEYEDLPIKIDRAKQSPHKYLVEDSIVYDLNSNSQLKEDVTFTGNDNDRLAGSYHFHYEYSKITSVNGFQLSYAKKFGSLWYEAFYQQLSGTFSGLAENQTPQSPTANSNPYAESRNYRPTDSSADLTLYGLGVGHRFKFFLDYFDTYDLFETINLYLTYNTLNDEFTAQSYSGWGLKADYGIHKRVNSSFFIGGRFSYNWAQVQRTEINDERADDRRLMLSWLNIAFEMGFYY